MAARAQTRAPNRGAVRLDQLRDLTDDDRAHLIRFSNYTRSDPSFLPYLEQTAPRSYEKVTVALRLLAIEARSEEWRSPLEGVGGRPEQLIPGTPGSFSDRTDWLLWLLVGGRGSGKSRTGAEAVREVLFGTRWTENPKVALVGQTLDAVRITMVENTLLKVLPSSSIVKWNRSTVELWVDVGGGRVAYLKGYSSDAPRRILGNEFHLVWADECASWSDADRSPNAEHTTWSNLLLATRAHDHGRWQPKIIATTTPKAVRLIRNLDPSDPRNPGKGLHDADTTVVSAMSTMDNLAHLPPMFWETTIKPLIGTRLFEQEVEGKLLNVSAGALWSDELVRSMRVPRHYPISKAGGLSRIVIGVDPSVGAGQGDECGIVVAGLGTDGAVYVLEDCSLRGTASQWCKVVADAYHRWGASLVVVEVNNGGELVEETLGRYAPNLAVVGIHAKVAKKVRADPVAMLSDRGLVRFPVEQAVDGPDGHPVADDRFSRLWFQMTTWDGSGPSPDRLDAFVYGVLTLLPVDAGASELITILRGGARTRSVRRDWDDDAEDDVDRRLAKYYEGRSKVGAVASPAERILTSR